jgi:lipoprotein
MLLRKYLLSIFLFSVVLFFVSCEKPSTEFSFQHDWRIESVSRAGVDVPDDAAIGDNYYFKKNGKCYITRHTTGEIETHTWRNNSDLKELYIDDFRYEIYKAEGNELVFGQVVEGKELFTFHTRKK